MLRALTLLVGCQFVGEVAARGAALPLPGPVLGLILLLAWLALRGGPDEGLKDTSTALLRHLGLLFVPAGVGIVTQLDALRHDWVAAGVAIVVSTPLGMGVTAVVMQRLLRPDPSVSGSVPASASAPGSDAPPTPSSP